MSKTVLTEVRGWSPLIDHMVVNYGVTAAAVFGRMWRYCQMKDGVCRASVDTIASDLGLARSTTALAIKKLCSEGFLRDLTPDRRHLPHIYQDTGKAQISSHMDATIRTLEGLRNSEAYEKPGKKGLRNSEAALRFSEGEASENQRVRPPKIGGKDSILREEEETKEDNRAANKTWDLLVNAMKPDVNKALYDQHIAPAVPLAMVDDILVIQVTSDLDKKILDSRFRMAMRNCLRGIVGPGADIQFVLP